jgi:hypothetical protein
VLRGHGRNHEAHEEHEEDHEEDHEEIFCLREFFFVDFVILVIFVTPS